MPKNRLWQYAIQYTEKMDQNPNHPNQPSQNNQNKTYLNFIVICAIIDYFSLIKTKMTTVNVLCLHGCNQTEESFRGYIRKYIKLGENNII